MTFSDSINVYCNVLAFERESALRLYSVIPAAAWMQRDIYERHVVAFVLNL